MTMTPVLDRVRIRHRLPDPRARRAIRLAAGVLQSEVAEMTGVSLRTVARWEAGDTTPRGEQLVRYVKVLDELRGLT